jgi:DNA replication protein DnaC
MLTHPTLDKLEALRLTGMVTALKEQWQRPDSNELSFEERLGLLVDREADLRQTRQMQSRLRKAKLRQNAAIEDIDFKQPRGLDRSLVHKLADCQWIRHKQNLLITGPTGVGKSYQACAFAHKTCREGFNALYVRIARLFADLALAKGDGRYIKIMATLDKTDLLEILEDRNGLRSTLMTSQLPVEHWHEQIGDPTMADAILDRLVHNAHTMQLKGGSMRKKTQLT